MTSYHDYTDPDAALPGDQTNGLEARLRQSQSLGKPLLVGEAGIKAKDGEPSCESLATRRDQFRRKLDGTLSAGAGGFLLWNFVTEASKGCNFDIAPGDPVLGMLAGYRA